jgi:hypothetical protein
VVDERLEAVVVHADIVDSLIVTDNIVILFLTSGNQQLTSIIAVLMTISVQHYLKCFGFEYQKLKMSITNVSPGRRDTGPCLRFLPGRGHPEPRR